MIRRLLFIAVGLIAAGGVLETAIERRAGDAALTDGVLVNVRGRQVYLSCHGSGSPTVVLEAGLGEMSRSWQLIAPAVAEDTRVCAYDRAGRGRSEATSTPLDGVGVAGDLHRLLMSADVPGPYVLVAHSSGAQYIRIFADRYPDQVAGMVLLDAQPAEALTRLPDYPAFYRKLRLVTSVLPWFARIGVGRLAADDDHASAEYYRSLRDEVAMLPTALAQAAASSPLGHRPLIVLTAVRDAQPGWLLLQDELVTLSRNSLHRLLSDATHASLVYEPENAEGSTRAIKDVVEAVRVGRLLNGGLR